jgi:hypothetical protein
MFELGESIGGVTGLIFAGNESAVRIAPSNRNLKPLGAVGSILFCASFSGGGSARATVAAIEKANAITKNLNNGLPFETPVPVGKTRPLSQGSMRDCHAGTSLAAFKLLALHARLCTAPVNGLYLGRDALNGTPTRPQKTATRVSAKKYRTPGRGTAGTSARTHAFHFRIHQRSTKPSACACRSMNPHP